MTEVSRQIVLILVGVGVFGIVLAILRLIQLRRVRSTTGMIRRLEGKFGKDLGKGEEEEREFREGEDLTARPALYGIPYLAWILTSLLIPAAFFVLFFENLIPPYPVPLVGEVAWFSYRAPAPTEFQGEILNRHTLLVEKGKRITSLDRRLIQAALRSHGRLSAVRVWGTLAILVIFTFILLYHINILYPSSTEKNKNLILIYLTLLVVLCCSRLALFYDLFSDYLIPVPWAGMVITIFVNRRIVPLIMLVTMIFVSIASSFDFSLFLVLLAGGLVSGSWVRRARKRSEVMVASLMVGAVMTGVYFCYQMLTAPGPLQFTPEALSSFSNGIFSGLLTLITLPVFEWIFDLASPFRLMELLDLNTPILKEFFLKAPGTYQHSMVVANIAEMVATEIGANGLLVRVGSYYHDIGKMFNPAYFIENQPAGKNPHDEIGPVASAAVVRSHVILGVKLARQIGLPGPVVDFIAEHHGTSTIDYFYYKSKQLDSGIKSERIFKYPGPKPQSKETAIVMVVDSVEAAFRVVEKRDEETIRGLVQKIAYRKLEQGELDRSGLTIGEFKKIIDVLTHILKSSSHQRIAYPETIGPSPAAKIRLFRRS